MPLDANLPFNEHATSLDRGGTVNDVPNFLKLLPDILAKNYANYDPFTECSREALQHKWHNRIVPNSWKHRTFKSLNSDKDVHCFRSNALNPHTEIRFGLGLNAVPMAYERGVKTLNDLGFNVVFMVLPLMGKEGGATEIYPEDSHHFFSNSNLEIDRGDNDNIDRIMIVHSMSGLCKLANTTVPYRKAEYDQRFIGTIDVAPFLGIAGANWEFNPNYRRLLAIQAKLTPDSKTGKTISGKLHHQLMKLLGEPQIFSSIDDLTYRQMLEFEHFADKVMEKIMQYPPISTNTITILPDKDNVACSKLGRKAALLTKSHIHETDAWHNPVVEHPHRSLSRIILATSRFKELKRQRELGLIQATASVSPAERVLHAF